jgi:RHS repeat-associated protein
VDVAPALDEGVVTRMLAATDFLYTGPNPIQTGVAPGTIVAERAAVLRGLVTDRNNTPLSGVSITILGHPELGQTLTRDDGMFDIAVNGGGQLTVDYNKGGFLSAQRRASVPWEDYVVLPTVVLIPLDPVVTSVDLTAAIPMQVARGSQVSDADGARQATVLVPQGTTATMTFANGTTEPINQLSVRATEYTVGPNGPNAMPAELPATSAYTYAVELSIDEAIAAGAGGVQFSAPLPFYVENFLGFPVGATVPFGMYDRQRGVWDAQRSGRVIRILSFSAGLANLDVDGDNVADTGAALAALAITDTERQQLATLYLAGQSLWRVLVPHFSPADLNWGAVPPPDAIPPPDDPELDDSLDNSCETEGSIIECENQILGEDLDVVGTRHRLHYRSDRVPGYRASYTVEIPLTGNQIPASLQAVAWRVIVAGRIIESGPIAPATNLRRVFTWDGNDTYGRPVSGAQRTTVQVLYTYRAVYGPTPSFGASAVLAGGAYAVLSRSQVSVFRTWITQLGTFHALASGLGGWTLSGHHAYDPIAQVLYRGDGRRENARSVGPSITTAAGDGTLCPSVGGTPCGDGGQATAAQLRSPTAMAVAPDGSLYIVTANVIRRVGRDGIISTVAGTGVPCSVAPCGDGGPATQAQLGNPAAVAVGPDNSIYIADRGNSQRVRKVGPDGIIRAFAGDGSLGSGGDGGPALLAQVSGVNGIAYGPDGSIFVSQSGVLNPRVRRIGPDGIITLYAGGGTDQTDPGPAVGAIINPIGIAVGPDGSLYIADNLRARIRRVTPDGIMRVIAGSGPLSGGYSGDGGLATQARLNNPQDVAVGSDGTVYIADVLNNRIRWLRPDGIIDTLAGTGTATTSGDGGLAGQAALQALARIALAPDGSIYFSQSSTNVRIRRIAPLGDKALASGLIVPSVDGTEVYAFTSNGRHLQTVDALTGAVRFDFTYDAAGRLAAITDADGNVTTVEHDAQGQPIGVVGPYGHRTALSVDANGYLASIAQPGGETVRLDHSSNGLLTGMMIATGEEATYAYDGRGRLISATDVTGATKTLTRAGTNKDHTTTLTTDLGRVSHYRTKREGVNNLDVRLITTDSAGSQSQLLVRHNGKWLRTAADGTTVDLTLGPDPRWGMRAPVPASLIIRTPSGLTRTVAVQRTVTLANPGNLLNLSSLTDTTTVNGRVFTAAYNGSNRTLTSTWPTSRQDRMVFDSHGRVIETQVGNLEPTDFAFDTRGRWAAVATGPAANRRVTTFTYGLDGFLKSVTDPLSRTFLLTQDMAGRVTQATQPSGDGVALSYDANGNLSSVTPPGQPSHSFGHSARSELISYAAPAVGAENRQTIVTYNADRQPTRIDRPDGQANQFQYDTAGRQSVLDLGTQQRTYTYDSANRLLTAGTSQAIGLTYTYDGALSTGALWSGPVAGSITAIYDNALRLATLSVNGANPIGIQYNLDSLPAQVGSLTLTRAAQTGLLTGTTLAGLSDTITYDGFGLPASYAASHSGNGVYAATYTRDVGNRLTSTTETIGGTTREVTYSYDSNGRLTDAAHDGVLTRTYTYDANGNRLSVIEASGTVSASYDAQDRLITYGTATYEYSPSGDLLQKTDGGQITTYDYDGASNLTGLSLPNGKRVDYLLDGRGRRVGRQIDGTLVQGFLYQDILRPIAELDGTAAVVSRFVYADSRTVPAYMIKGGATYRFITDHLGSPRLLVDVTSGQIVQRIDYDEFGMVVLDTNPGFQPFGFAGGLYDPLTGLVHFGAREYDAETGRWTTKDPGGFSGGPNLYAYASNDPVNLFDPLGNSPRGVIVTPQYQPASPLNPNAPPPAPPRPIPPPPPPPPPAPAPPYRYVPSSPGPPIIQYPSAPPPTGTYVPPKCPPILRVGGPLLASFATGYALGTTINEKTGFSHLAATTGYNAKDTARNAGFPDWLAETIGIGTTLNVVTGGPLSGLLSHAFGDD